MAKKNDSDSTVVNIATPGTVVAIMSGGDVSGNTVIVNGNAATTSGSGRGGRWLDDPADMDRSLIDDID